MRERERVYEKERVNHKCLISVVEPERKIKLNQLSAVVLITAVDKLAKCLTTTANGYKTR